MTILVSGTHQREHRLCRWFRRFFQPIHQKEKMIGQFQSLMMNFFSWKNLCRQDRARAKQKRCCPRICFFDRCASGWEKILSARRIFCLNAYFSRCTSVTKHTCGATYCLSSSCHPSPLTHYPYPRSQVNFKDLSHKDARQCTSVAKPLVHKAARFDGDRAHRRTCI